MEIRNLGVMCYIQGFTQYHYKAGDMILSRVLDPGFFNEALHMCFIGDMIVVSGSAGGMSLFVVSKANEAVVVEAMRFNFGGSKNAHGA